MNFNKYEVDLAPSKEEFVKIKDKTADFLSALKEQMYKDKIDADIFLGGSFAKGTLVKKEKYDVDFFVRFNWKYENISDLLEKPVKRVCRKLGMKIERVHGSRDYFHVLADKKIIFEIVPVLRIKRPNEARNVTDLSYFHVNYVKKKSRGRISNEIRMAKAFCHAQNVYGAESYIRGFSGYGLECLVIYYKGFEKMLRELVKVKERIVIDPEKKYKKKDEALFEMNENKLRGPIVLVDPTWKERNALGALSWETFNKFQKSAKAFLKNHKKDFFDKTNLDISKLEEIAKKNKAELLQIKIRTNRQKGDIAGTKMKKFANFLTIEFRRYFDVLNSEFDYQEDDWADFYLVVKRKKEVIKIGPPSKMKEHAAAFKKENTNWFAKNGIIHSKIKVDFTGQSFLERFKQNNLKKIKDMSITELKII